MAEVFASMNVMRVALPEDWRRCFGKKLADRIAAAIAETSARGLTTGRSSPGTAWAAALIAPLLEEGEGRRPRAPRPRRTTAAT